MGIRCLEECFSNTYQSHTGIVTNYMHVYIIKVCLCVGECMPCFEECAHGCTGPGSTLNTTNGCNKCNAILLDRNGEQVSDNLQF